MFALNFIKNNVIKNAKKNIKDLLNQYIIYIPMVR